ncbi:MAG: site-specific integrase, partial [Acidobacteria bacterium]|nr:site-specific integrase [Acidobacteriota bacterium]
LQEQAEGRLPTDAAKAKLEQVAPAWLAYREKTVARLTVRIDRERLKPLLKNFGERRLCDITSDHIRDYQVLRQSQVGPRTINLEIKVLRQILKAHKLWARIADDYKSLTENTRGPGRALADEQEKKLFATASSNPRWEVAYYAGLLAANTTARGCELKGLQLKDVDLMEGQIHIRSSKTQAGVRVVPLNQTALWAATRLYERAKKLGASEPEHYLFPACERAQIDVNVPQKTWRSAWRALTIEAGMKGLRFHDLRHHAITQLAEKGIPDQTLMAISGHVSRQMLDHYSHVRVQAKRDAVNAIDSAVPTEQIAESDQAIN